MRSTARRVRTGGKRGRARAGVASAAGRPARSIERVGHGRAHDALAIAGAALL